MLCIIGILKNEIEKEDAAVDVIDTMKIAPFCYTVLFGSCSTGNLKTSSDIDLLIVTKEQLLDRGTRSLIREKTYVKSADRLLF